MVFALVVVAADGLIIERLGADRFALVLRPPRFTILLPLNV